MKPYLKDYIHYFILGGIFLIPLIALMYSTEFYQPFQAVKGFGFRIIIEIIMILWLISIIKYKTYKIQNSWLLISLIAYLIVLTIANIFGENPFFSFFSRYSRMEGWLTISHVIGYFLILTSVLKSEQEWIKLLKISVYTSCLVSLIGLFQSLGIDFATKIGESERVTSTMGNPTYLAVYLLFNIFFTAIVWSKATNLKKYNFYYLVVILIQFYVLLQTGTRGVLIGFIVGSLVSLILFFILSNSKKKRQVLISTLALLSLAFIAISLSSSNSGIRNISGIERLLSISSSDSSVESRIILYKIAWSGIKEKPLLGWGQEGYNSVFYKYLESKDDINTVRADRTHSIVLEQLINAGVLGLVFYLLIFAISFISIWKKTNLIHNEQILLSGLLVAYFVQNLFFFDTTISYILFMTVLGYITFKSKYFFKSSKEKIIAGDYKYFESGIALITIFFAILIMYLTNIPAIQANLLLKKAVTFQEKGLMENLNIFKQALTLNTFGNQEIRSELLNIAVAVSNDPAIKPEIKNEYLLYTKLQMQLYVQEAPNDKPAILALVGLYNAYGEYGKANYLLINSLKLLPGNKALQNELENNKKLIESGN